MKIQWKKLLLCLALPLAVGGLSALLTGGMDTYDTLAKPPLSPPGWLFPIVWTILFLLMGYASYRVLVSGAPKKAVRNAWGIYILQLAFNFVWPLLFFRGMWLLVSLLWLIALWVLILLTVRSFSRIDSKAGDLLIPYLLWVTFAGYLNFGFYLLN